MPKKIFIGGLSFQTTSEDLQSLFLELGSPVSVRVAASEDGKGRVAYAEMSSGDVAAAAIRKLNGREVAGRKIVVRAEASDDDQASGRKR